MILLIQCIVELPKDFMHPDQAILNAHNRCRAAETSLLLKLRSNTTVLNQGSAADNSDVLLDKRLVNVRILGHLLSVVPSDTARSYIAEQVLSCEDDAALIEKGEHFDQYLFHAFYRFWDYELNWRTCVERSMEDLFRVPDKSVPLSAVESFLKELGRARDIALRRDDFKCMLSGMWEEEYCIACEKIIPNSKPRPLFALGLCECYCVFSPWIGFRKADEQDKTWDILEGLGYPEIKDELGDDGFTSLKNVLTLETTMRNLFIELCFWLEATDTPNRYRACIVPPYEPLLEGRDVPRVVEFTSALEDLDLPSEKYLLLHAICSKVGAMSGLNAYNMLLTQKLFHDQAPPGTLGYNIDEWLGFEA